MTYNMPGNFVPEGNATGFAQPRDPLPPNRPSDQPRRKRSLTGWIRALRRRFTR